MPTRKVSFDVFANDRVSPTFEKIASSTSELKKKLDAIAAKAVSLQIDADDKNARAKMLDIQAKLAELNKKSAKPNIDAVGFAKAEAQLAGLDAQLDAFGKKRVSAKATVDTSGIDRVMAKLGDLSVGSGLVKGVGIASLVPAVGGLAAAVPTLGAVTAGFTAAGLAAGGFAAVAVPAYKKIETNSKSLAKSQTAVAAAQQQVASATSKAQKTAADNKLAKALDQQNAALEKMTPQMRQAVSGYDSFTSSLHKFETANQNNTLPVISGGLTLIAGQLPKLTPLISGASGAFVTLEQDAEKALNSKFWTNFEQFVDKRGPQEITNYGKVAGNVLTGVLGTIQGFDPEIQVADRGLLGVSRDFANFGKSAAAGNNKPFNDFVTFSKSVAPQTKQDLRDIGTLAGNTLADLAPSVTPALKLVDDLAKGLGPVIKPVEKELPGVITDVDKLVTKASPLAAKLSSAFSSGAAKSIHSFASGAGDLVGFLDKIPEPILHAVGEDIGIIVTSATLSKLTGLSKLSGYLTSLGGAGLRAEAGLDAAAAGERNLAKASASGGIIGGVPRGSKAPGGTGGKILGALSNLPNFAFDAYLGGQIGEQIGRSGPVEKFSTDFEHLRNNAEKLPGPLGSVAKAFNKVDTSIGNHLPGFLQNVQTLGGKGTEDMSKFVAVTEKLPNLAKPITVYEKVNGQKDFEAAINRAKAKAQDLANQKVVTKLQAKDAASHIIAGVQNSATVLSGTPGIAHLSAQDKASSNIAKVKSGLASIPSKHNTNINALNKTGDAAARARADIDSVKDKSVSISAAVSGLGAVASLGGAIGALHSKTVTVGVQQVGSAAGLGHFAGFADGGYTGAGSKLQPAGIVHAGEFVVNAQQTPKYLPLLKAINDGAPGFASGGKVPPLIAGTRFRTYKGFEDAGQKLLASILAAFSSPHSASSIDTATKSIISRIDSDFTGDTRSGLVRYTQRVNDQMTSLAKARDRIANKLAAANELSTSVTSAAKSSADISQFTALGSNNLLKEFSSKLASINRFSANIATMKRHGFSSELIAELLAAGIDQAAPIAAQLAKARPAQVHQFNATQRAVDRASKKLGTVAVNAQFGTSVARSFVASLKSQQNSLEKQMQALAKVFAKGVGRAFHLKGYASGGDPRGLAVVGEHGAEIVDFGAGGAHVFSNAQSQRMVAGAISGTGGDTHAELVAIKQEIQTLHEAYVNSAHTTVLKVNEREMGRAVTRRQKIDAGRGPVV